MSFLSTDSHSVASNSSCILFSDHSQLFLYDHSLNLVDQSDIRDDILVRDLGWVERLNHFVVLSDKHLFLLDERRFLLDRSSAVETPPNGHWHRLTWSADHLYLTAYRWGTRIYQYKLSSGTIQFYRCFEMPSFSTRNESIDCLVHNQRSCIAMTVTNRLQKGKRFDLRLDDDFTLVWSMELRLSDTSLRPTQFASIGQDRWVVVDSDRSEMIHISSDGSIEQTLPYPSEGLQRIRQIQPNLLLVLTDRCANLHQLV